MPRFSNRDARRGAYGTAGGDGTRRRVVCWGSSWVAGIPVPEGASAAAATEATARRAITATAPGEDICEALLRRDDVDSSDVTVAVHEGEVTLDGSVPQRCMRYLIEDLAAGHPAVTDVDNRIKVRKA